MTDNPPPGPGRVVAGRYLLQQRLGRGGMSTVWRARDQVLDRDVAVKIVAEMEDAEVTAERFRREARATAALNHPNIVTVFDAGVDDGRAFLVMELLPGHTLADEVRARGALPVEEVREIAVQVAGALSAAHAAGLVHRDIKPGNIARTAGGAAKVLDFGITHIIDEGAAHASHPLTATGAVIGTAAFLAPEQARGERVDGRADLYSLGCVLYALLTGQPPFRGATAVTTMMMHATEPAPRVLGARPDLPEGFAVVIQAMLQKDPNDRPQSADAVARAIRAQTPEEAAAYLPVPGANDDTTVMPARAATPADPADAEEPFQMEEAEGRRTRLLIGMVAVALLVAAGFAWWLLSQNASL
ncbi:MAG: protein kinase, partial [Propionibacteriaceae bacterium]|nr:protein kinase [Propionibacteriaceae bacterium]